MIRGLHGLFYTSQPEEMRAFIRDKLQLPYTDVGGGWLIFDLKEGEVGCHPLKDAVKTSEGSHELSFYCDDIKGTVATLKQRGVVFDHDIEDREYGYVTSFTMPGDVKVDLYEPKYAKRAQRRQKRGKASRGTKEKAKRESASRRRSAKKGR